MTKGTNEHNPEPWKFFLYVKVVENGKSGLRLWGGGGVDVWTYFIITTYLSRPRRTELALPRRERAGSASALCRPRPTYRPAHVEIRGWNATGRHFREPILFNYIPRSFFFFSVIFFSENATTAYGLPTSYELHGAVYFYRMHLFVHIVMMYSYRYRTWNYCQVLVIQVWYDILGIYECMVYLEKSHSCYMRAFARSSFLLVVLLLLLSFPGDFQAISWFSSFSPVFSFLYFRVHLLLCVRVRTAVPVNYLWRGVTAGPVQYGVRPLKTKTSNRVVKALFFFVLTHIIPGSKLVKYWNIIFYRWS